MQSVAHAAENLFVKMDDDAANTTVVVTTGTGGNAALQGGNDTADVTTAGPGNVITKAFGLNGTDVS